MSLKPCIWCDGGGCDERAARKGAEQGATPIEIELARVRDELARERAAKLRAEVAAAEAQRSEQTMRERMNDAFAQLAILSKGGLA